MKTTLPVVFLGHGSPMNTLEENAHTHAWQGLGRDILSHHHKPRAVLMISAHWYVNAVALTAMAKPRTIHDFRGFPPSLQSFDYPAPGAPDVAREVAALLQAHLDEPVLLDGLTEPPHWGLDHGTWSVLAHVFPEADIPVVQLSIDARQPPVFHFAIGQHLAPLRAAGILVMASGNIVHNLGMMRQTISAYDWAIDFDAAIAESLARHDDQALIHYKALPGAKLAVPTPEHYLPLLYIAGMRRLEDEMQTLDSGIEMAAISMRSVRFG